MDKLDPIDKFLEAETKADRDWQPNYPDIFRALELTTPDTLSVVIIAILLRTKRSLNKSVRFQTSI